jgi:NAD(P)H-dependent FMN reductase
MAAMMDAPIPPKQLLILHASQTEAGYAYALAQAALHGAQAEVAVQSRLLPALRAGVDDLLAAHAVLFVTPEKFGYMAGALKDFFDRTFYPTQGLRAGLPYALVVVASNDGQGAVTAVTRIAQGYPLKPVAEAWVVKGTPTDEDLDQAKQLGQALATGVACGVF